MVDSSTLYRGLVTRLLRVPGLSEAHGLLGPGNEPNSVVDRSFAVSLGGDSDAGERVRAGEVLTTWLNWTVTLAHRVRVKDTERQAMEQVLQDRDAVRRVILAEYDDAIAPLQHHIHYDGTEAPSVVGGGGFILTTIRWRVLHHLDLSVTP